MVDVSESRFVQPAVNVSINHHAEGIKESLLLRYGNHIRPKQNGIRFQKSHESYRIFFDQRQVIHGTSRPVVRLLGDILQSADFPVADCGFNESGWGVPRTLERARKYIPFVATHQMPLKITSAFWNKPKNRGVFRWSGNNPSPLSIPTGADLHYNSNEQQDCESGDDEGRKRIQLINPVVMVF
jgi:hypothetical protein